MVARCGVWSACLSALTPRLHLTGHVGVLGVILYELMALQPPFVALDMATLKDLMSDVEYPPPPQVYSAELLAVLPLLLEKDASRRLEISELLELSVFRPFLEKYGDLSFSMKQVPGPAAALVLQPVSIPVPVLVRMPCPCL